MRSHHDAVPAPPPFALPERRRVLFVTDSDKRFSGGIKQLYLNLLGLRQRGHAVYLAAQAAAPIANLAAPLLSGSLTLDFGTRRHAAHTLGEYCTAHGIDTVHAFHTRAYKVAVWAHHHRPRFGLYVNRGVSFPVRHPLYLHYPGIAGYVCNSEAVARMFMHRLVPQARVNVIYNAFVPDGGAFHGAGRETPLHDGSRIVCVTGSGRWKGLPDVLRAFNLLADTGAHLYVVGVPDEPRHREPLTPEAQARTHFLGQRDDVPALLERMDVLTLAPTRGDSCPNVVLEAFHAGLPVVGTAVGGIPELVQEGVHGHTVPAGDHGALAVQLRALLADPARARAMGERNRERIGLFALERKLDSLERLYAGHTVRERI